LRGWLPAKATVADGHDQRRGVNGEFEPFTADDAPDEPNVAPFGTDLSEAELKVYKDAFRTVFAAPPKQRGLSLDGVSYEELQQLYHSGPYARAVLFAVVKKLNAGAFHPDAADLLGDSALVALYKPDGRVRPIGMGTALRRLAGRVMMAVISSDVATVLTTSEVTPEQLLAAGYAADTPCLTPLQLGCGFNGGAEVLFLCTRLALEKKEWAVVSDDKKNGFNAISRESIVAALRRWFPELLPHFRFFYGRQGGLFVSADGGRLAACDKFGNVFTSAEGCTQGDPLGPLYFALGYHQALLESQARSPDVLHLAYLDDTYYLAPPRDAFLACRRGEDVCAGGDLSLYSEAAQALLRRPAHASRDGLCGVHSNRGKQEVYARLSVDLTCLTADRGDELLVELGSGNLRGVVGAPADEKKGYDGGRLLSTKVLGSFLGDRDECARRLCKRVANTLEPLDNVAKLRDFKDCTSAGQVQHCLTRYCANTSLVYFLRTMGVEATREAAVLHDGVVSTAFFKAVGAHLGSAQQQARAELQVRLPVRLGGFGLTRHAPLKEGAAGLAHAATVGSWALCWGPLQSLCPTLFGGANLEADEWRHLPSVAELLNAHSLLRVSYDSVAATYDLFDLNFFDYEKSGVKSCKFHPSGLPARYKLVPVSELHLQSDDNKHVQRLYSQVLHHAAWLDLHFSLHNDAPAREQVRFLAVSQPHAGAFLNAVPKWAHFRVRTTNHRTLVQRRLGLPVRALVHVSASARSKNDKRFDVLGDVAQNDGHSGHQTRHKELAHALREVLKRVYGAQLTYEPKDSARYSDHRPDFVLRLNGVDYVWDVKVFDPLGSSPSKLDVRGATVGFGNTAPDAHKLVLGLRQQGVPGDGNFRPGNGQGYVPAFGGDYARAQDNGYKVVCLLAETFGGFHQGLLGVLYQARDLLEDRLSRDEYDRNSWTTTKWFTYAVQRLSVALHNACATELHDAVDSALAAAHGDTSFA
jgi:hypothetical protein